MRSLVEPIGSLDSFAAHWLESAPLVGAVLAESLDLLADSVAHTAPPHDLSPELSDCFLRTRERQQSTARELKRLAEEARALADRLIPENFLLRVRRTIASLRYERELERELLFDAHGWRDIGVCD